MLQTPLGSIVVKMNDVPIKYCVEALPLTCGEKEEILFAVDGRYKIVPVLDSHITFPLRLSCSVDCELDTIDVERSGLETGERLFLTSLYRDNQKISIGAYDELEGLEGYGFSLNEIEIIVTAKSFLEYAFFCVAWLTLSGDDYETNGDIYSWFAADPN